MQIKFVISDMSEGVRQRKKLPPKVNKTEEYVHPSAKTSYLHIYLFAAIMLACLSAFGYGIYMKQPVHPCTVSNLPMIENDISPVFTWGTYRPNSYFSLKAKIPHSPVFGVFFQEQPSINFQPQRLPGSSRYDIKIHANVENNDKIQRMGWLEHDGENFGSQDIILKNFQIRTQFLKAEHSGKHAGKWTSRITIVPNVEDVKVSLYMLIATEAQNGKISYDPATYKARVSQITGLEDFEISLLPVRPARTEVDYFISNPEKFSNSDFVSEIEKHAKIDTNRNGHFVSKIRSDPQNNPELVVLQITVDLKNLEPVEFDVVHLPDSLKSTKSLIGDKFTTKFNSQSASFAKQVQYKLRPAEQYKDFVKSGLSNMLGGIGYFYGEYLVKGDFNNQLIHKCEPAELFSASPSRPQFPRGFLWDEGFHLILINKWNSKLAKASLVSWLNRMMYSGWIPREQMLGYENMMNVPDEFIRKF